MLATDIRANDVSDYEVTTWMRRRTRASIRSGLFNPLHDQHVHDRSLGVEPQAKLLAHGGEQRHACASGGSQRIGSPLEIPVESAGQPGSIDNHSIRSVSQVGDQRGYFGSTAAGVGRAQKR